MSNIYDTDSLMEEWRINGFVVFDDLIPPAIVDRIREAWIPIRQRDVIRQGEQPSRGWGRYNVRVPFKQPFVEPDIFEHPAVVEFLGKALGADYIWAHFDSNIPLPVAAYQHWHRDVNLPFPGIMTPAFTVGVKFPLVDTNEANGSVEVMPGTQYVSDPDLQYDLDQVFGSEATPTGNYKPIRLNLKKGALWIHDARIFHRGTPNHTDTPRDELCMAMCRPWLFNQWQHNYTDKHFPRKLWDSLSEHARHVLRWQRVQDQ